jgi:hypothetical protein
MQTVSVQKCSPLTNIRGDGTDATPRLPLQNSGTCTPSEMAVVATIHIVACRKENKERNELGAYIDIDSYIF